MTTENIKVLKTIKYFSNLTLNQLRRYQEINEQQIKLAFEQRKEEALEQLQICHRYYKTL